MVTTDVKLWDKITEIWPHLKNRKVKELNIKIEAKSIVKLEITEFPEEEELKIFLDLFKEKEDKESDIRTFQDLYGPLTQNEMID